MTKPMLDGLPENVQKRLDTLTRTAESLLKDQLSAILVFGSAIRGGYQEGKSDVDVIIVLKNDTPEILSLLSEPLRLARFSARIEAILLTEQEIPRAADVFPLFYDDIRQKHLLLFGKDPFSELHISDKHRRIRIEQELRELQIRLRRAMTDAAHTNDHLSGLIYRKLRQLRGPLHALLKLQGYATSDVLHEVLRTAATLYQLDLAPLYDIKKSPPSSYEALIKLLHAAIHDVDSRDDDGK